MRVGRHVRRALLGLVAAFPGALAARADVVFDGSTRPDGQRTELPAFRGQYLIEEAQGARPGGGINLFHSFERLDVEAELTARFLGSAGLRNVIARVTGGAASRIDGALASDIPGVQLFLLNRHGILLGPGSRVDVTGGFFATSSPLLRLGSVELRSDAADHSFEGAVEPVSAFVFRTDAPAGPVRLDGAQLRFAPAAGVFGFVGGEVEIRGGQVSARAGDVALAAVDGDGAVLLRDAERADGLRRIDFEDVSAGGPVRIVDGALVSTSGIEPGSPLEPGSGEIAIRAGELVIEDSEVDSVTAGGLPGGDIDIEVLGDARIERRISPFEPGLATQLIPSSFPPAPAGDIRLVARSLAILGGAKISTSTEGGAPGGSTEIVAERVVISGASGPSLSSVRSNASSTGDAGRISIRAGELWMDDSGALVVESRAPGRAGDIDIEVDALSLSGNARIDSSIRSSGAGGDIRVRVTGDAQLTGAASDEKFTGITTLGHETSSALAGTIELHARRVQLADGARISARSAGTGDAGSVRIEATDSIELGGGAGIATDSENADGGDIVLSAPGRIELVDSRVSASVRSGAGGNVSIDPEFLILDDSQIEARAEDGTGGNIRISTEFLLASPDSLISADSQRGIDGTVVIRSPSSDATAGPAAIAAAYRDPQAALAERCAASRAGSFVAAGLAAPPWTPDQPRFALHPGLARPQALESRGDLEGALALLAEEPLDAAHQALRGRLRVRLGDDAQGQADLAAALEGSAGQGLAARIRLDRALLRATRGEREAALGELEGEAEPGLRAAIETERAALLAALGRADAARAAWTSAHGALAHTAEDAERVWIQLRLARVGQALGVSAAQLARLYADSAQRAAAHADPSARGFAWSHLAELYAREARLDDAAELALRSLVAAQQAHRPELELRVWWQAGRVALARGDLAAAERDLRRARAGLVRLRDSSALAPLSQREFARALPAGPLLTDLVDVLLRRAARTEDPAAREALLREARDQLEDLGAAELRDYFQDACAAPLRRAAPRALSGVALVHPVLLADRAELIVELPTGIRSVLLPASGPQLARAAHELRVAAEDRAGFRFWRPAQQLHDWIVRPLERELEGLELEALVFAPLGALRGMPFAALHDRERGQFLIERYPVAVTPGTRLMSPDPVSHSGTALLRAGLTRSVQGYPALGHVSAELAAIGGIFAGPELVDERFVEPVLAGLLESNDFPIVHLASHGEFGGALEQSFVLTFDGKLRVDELAALVRRDPQRERAPLELLTLSACQTAAGDDGAALGLAGVAVEAGARSALATLWYVDDASSGRLMAEFYRQLAGPRTSRARALQRAQLELLRSRASSHPAYWAPFVLIGSWL